MKKIGIIVAEDKELECLLNEIDSKDKEQIYDLTIYKGLLNNIELVIVKAGIGKVNAARTTQILIDYMKPDYIMNIGVAGSISNEVGIGDIVLGEKLAQHDFDLTDFGRKKGEIPNINGIYIESDKKLLELASKVKVDAKVHIGVIASGDIFISNTYFRDKISSKFNALCVEMEGASIAQVCYLSNVPFLVIRSISDTPNGNNKMTFDEFIEISSKKVANYLKEIINNI